MKNILLYAHIIILVMYNQFNINVDYYQVLFELLFSFFIKK
jgi:hypothetical protein